MPPRGEPRGCTTPLPPDGFAGRCLVTSVQWISLAGPAAISLAEPASPTQCAKRSPWPSRRRSLWPNQPRSAWPNHGRSHSPVRHTSGGCSSSASPRSPSGWGRAPSSEVASQSLLGTLATRSATWTSSSTSSPAVAWRSSPRPSAATGAYRSGRHQPHLPGGVPPPSVGRAAGASPLLRPDSRPGPLRGLKADRYAWVAPLERRRTPCESRARLRVRPRPRARAFRATAPRCQRGAGAWRPPPPSAIGAPRPAGLAHGPRASAPACPRPGASAPGSRA